MSLKTKSAGGVVLNSDGQVLVVSQHGHSWSLPKGHTEPNETGLETAYREIYEETGVSQLELLKELGTYSRYKISITQGDDTSELKEITLYLFKTTQINLKPIDPNHPQAKWVTIEEVPKLLTHSRDKEFFIKLIPTIQEYILKEKP